MKKLYALLLMFAFVPAAFAADDVLPKPIE
jgi:hypothetical protein